MLLIKKVRTVLVCLSLGILCHTTAYGGEISVSDGAKSPFFNVVDYGARNDGSSKATLAIKKAIDAAVKQGGGTVYFPAGTFLTGPIHLKSNITIFIDAGALLKFSTDFDDYLPMVKSRWEGIVNMNFSPLFYAYQADNIAIIGRGIIDGQGQKWWDVFNQIKAEYKQFGTYKTNTKWQKMHKQLNKNITHTDWRTREGHFFRPPFIQPFECNNVLITGITIRNSPFWNITPTFCKNVTIDGVTIESPANSPNTDGIDPSSCSQVRISNCFITVGDDCIVIKSGKDEDGRKYNVPSENISITNCTMLSGHGGVVIGSEMSGGVKGVAISNCVFDGTDRGIRIKSMRGRGAVVENIRVDNIVMRNIGEDAININMFYKKTDPEPLTERTPTFRNFHFSNITVVNTHRAASILGLPENPAEEIIFSDIDIVEADEGFIMRDAKDIGFHNVRVNCKKGSPFSAERISGLELDDVKSPHPVAQAPLISLTDVQNAYITNCNVQGTTQAFLAIEGASSDNVVLKFNHIKDISRAVRSGKQVPEGAFLLD